MRDGSPGTEMLGFPPRGRHQWTWDALRAEYAPTTSFGETHRGTIWEHFRIATETLRSVVPVAAVWIGGSFLSPKGVPGDIDAVYIIGEMAYEQLSDDRSRQIVGLFQGGNHLKGRGIQVDSYVFFWAPRASNGFEDEAERNRLAVRGYWDDWLQRHKLDRLAPATEADALPVRGYVEVILDDFTT